MLIETRYGFRIQIDPTRDKSIDEVVYYYGGYEVGTLSVLKLCLRRGDTFVDIGSNIGLMSLYGSKIVGETGKIYSLEANPSTFVALERNLKLNGTRNVHAINVAAGSKKGTATLYENATSRGNATLIGQMFDETTGVAVSIESVDELAAIHHFSSPRMVKIDVEGWELEVLQGARNLLSQPTAPILCIEYSDLHPIHGGDVTEIYSSILSANEYAIYKLKRGKHSLSKLEKINGMDELPRHDNIFCFLPSHLESVPRRMFS